jgi:hypothetical protein
VISGMKLPVSIQALYAGWLRSSPQSNRGPSPRVMVHFSGFTAGPIRARRTNSNLPQNNIADLSGIALLHSRRRIGNNGVNASNSNPGSKLRKGRRDRLESALE